MPISYKNKIYTTLGTPTDVSGDVTSVTNSAGVPAKDYTVKGKTVVWNQMVESPDFSNTTVDARAYVSFRVQQSASPFEVFLVEELQEPGLVSAIFTITTSGDCRIKHNGSVNDIDFCYFASVKDHKYYICFNFTSTNPTVVGGITYNKAQLFDLTQMFGSGNEPTTVAQFQAMFPDDYYPYNAGELKSIAPTSVEASGVERFQMFQNHNFSNTVVDTREYVIFMISQLKSPYTRFFSQILQEPGLVDAVFTTPASGKCQIKHNGSVRDIDFYYFTSVKNHKYYIYINFTSTNPTVAGGVTYDKAQLFDLTQMFGAGNEPATPAEFWQRVPERLYSYNPNDYKSANIPSSKYFPDGMKSAGSVYDEINFLSQKAIKRIGAVDMGTLNWSYTNVSQFFYTLLPGAYPFGNNVIPNIICSAYEPRIYSLVANISASDGGININGKDFQPIPRLSVKDRRYSSAAAFKAAMSGVMLYYELETPVETAITPPLQALSTFKDFTSFSAPNSLMQNGPLSVTYYAEGGASPEKGWLMSYKRKLYMGRNIEWNQLFTNSVTSWVGVTISNNQDGTMTLNGTVNRTYINFTNLSDAMNRVHKYLLCLKILNNPDSVSLAYGWLNRNGMRTDIISNGESCTIRNQTESATQLGTSSGLSGFEAGTVFNNVKIAVMVMDLTQMFGAGNEPATPEEFWSYFDHKLYPYNPGETQPLFKISRKSRMGAKHYTARWDKVNAKMVRLNDAASFPTDTSNFGNFGSVNPDYDNPFDSIYPWSGIRLCNIDLDAYTALQPGDSITKCVKAWDDDPDFSYTDENGVWRYRPEFWGKSWDDGTYRYFDVTDKPIGGYVHYPEEIAGCWHGRALTRTVNGEPTTCLLPHYGIPAARIPLSTLHTYAKNYGATLDSIYSIDADTLLLVVEYATMNSQIAIGNGVTNLYRQGGYQIAAAATDSNVIKVLAADAGDYFVYGAIVDIGTTDGGNQVGSYFVSATAPDTDPTYLNVTLTSNVTVTRENYWSIHGIINDTYRLQNFINKSGYLGANGRSMAFYRGMELYGNMWFYTLGAYENDADKHIWIAADAEQADAYDALDTSVHIDTGLVLPTSVGYIQTLGLPPRSGLLALPPFCTAVGGNSTNPVGDYSFNMDYTYNTVLIRGGSASSVSYAGALTGHWYGTVTASSWGYSARPRLKNP